MSEASSSVKDTAEVTELHTRLQRLALGVEESRAYWTNVDPEVPFARRALVAFERRWFGAKSLERVRTILADLTVRYDAVPPALAVLRRWRGMDPATRRSICHWHLQLADPLYRRFAGHFLVERREGPRPTLDRPVVLRWVKDQNPHRWGAATCVQFASKLLSAAKEAGLVTPRDPRTILVPKVTDLALGYWLHFLRHVEIEGTLLENPYFASVGLSGTFLHERLRGLRGVRWHRMGDLDDVEWSSPTLTAWAEATL